MLECLHMFGFGKGSVDTDPEKIEKLLTRNVEEIFVKESLRKKLLSGQKLNIKLGFDPTGDKIHIGRAIVLRKLREFQDLGHQVIFLVGDFTARIGDPSDKLSKRPMLSQSQILENLKDYKNQVGKIIDLSKAKFVFNSEWLSKLKFDEIADLAESFTVSQMISRRNFSDRLEKGDEISLREFLYPLMQGYDSFILKADVELGGFDQLFNLKAGRIIQKHYDMAEQDIIATIMLEGTDGRKMSTSWGNVINIVDSPNEMYGKTMSIRDDLIEKYFQSCTNYTAEQISEIKSGLENGSLHPKKAKMILAKELVTIYHGESEAQKAEDNFDKTFSQGDGVPDDVLSVNVAQGVLLADVLLANKLIESKSEWRRLVVSSAIENVSTKEKIEDANFTLQEDATIKIGKKRFIQISVK